MFKVPLLRRTLQAALRDVEAPKFEVRLSAVKDLGRLAQGEEREQVLGALVGALKEDGAAGVRAEAAVALADAQAREHTSALLAATDDEHPRVRQMALLALGEVSEVGDEKVRAVLAGALTDEAPALRFQALIALHGIDGEAALPTVIERMDDDDPQVRYIAFRIAEEHWLEHAERGAPPPNVIKRARRALDDCSDKVRLAAAIFLVRAGDDSGRPQIVAAVNHGLGAEEPEDEQTAVELAGELGLKAARPGLMRRAWGLWGILRGRFGFQARIALAKLGDRRAIEAIKRGLSAWTRDSRTLAVVAAGRARVAEAREQILAMRGDERRADQEAVEEALSLLRGEESEPEGNALPRDGEAVPTEEQES